jgi:hypothetical protein
MIDDNQRLLNDILAAQIKQYVKLVREKLSDAVIFYAYRVCLSGAEWDYFSHFGELLAL